MKYTGLVLTLFWSLGAQASFFQEFCSNAEGTLVIAGGHAGDLLVVTQRVWSNDGTSKDTAISLAEDEVEVTFSDEKEISRTSSNSCKKGDEWGIGFWQTVAARKIKITRVDEQKFDENVLDVSEDRKSVSAYVICQENGNSETSCD